MGTLITSMLVQPFWLLYIYILLQWLVKWKLVLFWNFFHLLQWFLWWFWESLRIQKRMVICLGFFDRFWWVKMMKMMKRIPIKVLRVTILVNWMEFMSFRLSLVNLFQRYSSSRTNSFPRKMWFIWTSFVLSVSEALGLNLGLHFYNPLLLLLLLLLFVIGIHICLVLPLVLFWCFYLSPSPFINKLFCFFNLFFICIISWTIEKTWQTLFKPSNQWGS